MLVFVCGPHSAGKTTLIGRLKDKGVVSVAGDEIGKRLFYERCLNTGALGPEFELEVVERELERDAGLASTSGIKVIETWHPGNLAYAAVRNPSMIPELLDRCTASPLFNRACGIYLRIPHETIAVRTKTFSSDRQWAKSFYGQIDLQIPLMLDRLGLADRTLAVDASRSLDVVYDEVESWLRTFQADPNCARPHASYGLDGFPCKSE